MEHFHSSVSAGHSDLTVACLESDDGERIVTGLIITSGDTRTLVHMSPNIMRALALALVHAAEKREIEEAARALDHAAQVQP